MLINRLLVFQRRLSSLMEIIFWILKYTYRICKNH